MTLKGDRRDHRAREVALAVVEQLARQDQAILRVIGCVGIDLFESGERRLWDRINRLTEGEIIADRRARIEIVAAAGLAEIETRLESGGSVGRGEGNVNTASEQ